MKKKRLLSLLLVLALIMAFLPACGTDGTGGNEGGRA